MHRVTIVRQYNNNNGVLNETKTQKLHSKCTRATMAAKQLFEPKVDASVL